VRQIVIDTNLLVLLVVGLTDRKLIDNHKRLKQFEQEDFELLTGFLAGFDQIFVTPHIVTETCNLISQINDPAKSSVRATLASLLATAKEEFKPSVEVARHNSFFRLGLTDCAILDLIQKKTPFVTVDLELFLAASKVNNNAMNFNHLRLPRLLS
jgi:predicted nucleic acid-binding protein